MTTQKFWCNSNVIFLSIFQIYGRPIHERSFWTTHIPQVTHPIIPSHWSLAGRRRLAARFSVTLAMMMMMIVAASLSKVSFMVLPQRLKIVIFGCNTRGVSTIRWVYYYVTDLHILVNENIIHIHICTSRTHVHSSRRNFDGHRKIDPEEE